jgi:chromosome segregation ATPase
MSLLPNVADKMSAMAETIRRQQTVIDEQNRQAAQMKTDLKYLTELHTRDMQRLEEYRTSTERLEATANEFDLLTERLGDVEKENDELQAQNQVLTRDNTTIAVQFENLAEEFARVNPRIQEVTERNKKLIALSEQASEHTACNRQISELKSAYQQLEDEKALAMKQVRGLCDHYEESVAENMRKDKIIHLLTVKHNEAASKFNEVAQQLVEIQSSDQVRSIGTQCTLHFIASYF